MAKKALKVLKVVIIIIIVLTVLILAFFFYISRQPAVPKNYIEKVETGGEVESKYLNYGEFDVKNEKITVNEPSKEIEIFYPEELENSNAIYPVVLYVNGTGVSADKYTEVFEHLSSWGFITVGNEDVASGKGDSSEQTISCLLEQNENPDSKFYHKVDTENIGIVGYSQGGAGMYNAITVTKHSNIYKTGIALSPANEPLAQNLEYPYDISKVTIPTLLFAGNGDKMETGYVIPFDTMTEMYDRISSTTKVMAIKSEKKHEETLYVNDGYITAWFMYFLQNDETAGKAFFGNQPELESNKLYQDVQINRRK